MTDTRTRGLDRGAAATARSVVVLPTLPREDCPWRPHHAAVVVHNGKVHRVTEIREWTNSGAGDPAKRATFTDYRAACGVEGERSGGAWSLQRPPAYRNRALSCKDGCWEAALP